MKNVDVQLIQSVLDGDDTAFSELVNKYQKSVHALVWRKIGDFHIAEDITQETFLKAYQKLSTLKESQSFASWLYVIAANQCKAWLRKKRLSTQSLESTNNVDLEKATYSNYVSAENQQTSVEAQREVVKKLLAKLQESDRTVITLYYLGGMTYEEISRFLGVSVSAIKNRLYRARQYLKKEEPMIREALENYQITPRLTDNIMQEISRLKPTPSVSKPLVPWAVATTSAILIVLMLGLGSQSLVRFQQPYSLDAQAEMTVELVDAPIVLNVEAESNVRNQFGSDNVLSKSENNGQQVDEVFLAAAETEEDDRVSVPKQQWIQGNTPAVGLLVSALYPTSEGEIYSVDGGGMMYKLPIGGTEWQQVNDISSLLNASLHVPMVKWNDTLFVVASNELFASTDGGKTLLPVGKCPVGMVVGLVVMDDTFYLALENGVFRSTDTGKTWSTINDGLSGDVATLHQIQNTLFATTDTGLYRFKDDSWEHLQVPVSEDRFSVSFAGVEDVLYVLIKLFWVDKRIRSWWIFRSTDKGNSWTDISPTNAWPFTGRAPSVTLAAAGKTLLAIGESDGTVVRSIDSGDTWMLEQTTGIPIKGFGVSHAFALDEKTFYTIGNAGILHSIDGGISWKRAKLYKESLIDNLIFIRTNKGQNQLGCLYAMNISEVFKSNDLGKSWWVINPKIQITEFGQNSHDEPPEFTRIGEAKGILFAKHGGESLSSEKTGLYRIATDGNTFVPIEGMPILDSGKIKELWSQRMQGALDMSDETLFEQLQEKGMGSTQFFKQLARGEPNEQNQQVKNQLYMEQNELLMMGLRGGFAISGDVYFIEYNFKLFRWEPGDKEWYDTGVEETTPELVYRKAAKAFEQEGLSQEKIWDIITSWSRGFKLAVSGDTIYVGKRDGHLVVSLDKGNNWINLTSVLPFPVKAYNDIVIVGETVYVATDAGVAASDRGNNWGTITDAEGANLVMEHLVADGTKLYGVTKETGIYHLENGTWNQIVSDIPDNITSLAVDGNTLYVGTLNRGMLHFTLEE